MATNDRVTVTTNDITHGQQAASQAARTSFTPGKATSRQGDMNWEKDFRIPQGTPAFSGEAAGPVEMNRVRSSLIGRGIVSDQALHGNGGVFPHTTGAKTTTITDARVWGATTPVSVVTPVTENSADGRYERAEDADKIVGA